MVVINDKLVITFFSYRKLCKRVKCKLGVLFENASFSLVELI